MSFRFGEIVTKSGYRMDEVTSALQKSIRRAKEKEAVYWAIEIAESGYDQYLWKRLVVIACEDVGIGNPTTVNLVATLRLNWDSMRTKDRLPEYNMIAMAVIQMCRSLKSRECDDLAHLLDCMRKDKGLLLEIPDEALDGHTERGRRVIKKASKERGTSILEEKGRFFYEDSGLLSMRANFAGTKWGRAVSNYYGSDSKTYSTTEADYFRYKGKKREGLHIYKVDGSLMFSSVSDANKYYKLNLKSGKCSCPAAKRGKVCWHSKFASIVLNKA